MRRRLIDSLSAAQESALNEVSPSDSEAHDANTSSDFKVRRRENVGSPQTDQNRIPKTSTASIESARETRTSAPPALLRSRITYARQRSFLGSALNDSVSGIHDAPVAALNNTEAGILSVAHKATTSLPLSADGDDPGRPVRSIHELRQAGDNARFQESVESLFDDIDNPGNSTSDICNGIIQLCKKLLEPNFMHRFSENAFDERLVKCTLGNLDVVPTCLTLCAYRLVCLKGIHSYSHLRTFWARLVDRSQSLLMVKDDIMSLAGKPRSHLSKAVQASLRDLIPQLTFLLFPDSTAPKLYPHLIILSCIQYCLAVFQDKSHRIESMSPPMLSSLVGLLLPNSAESPTHPPLHNNFQTKSMTLRILESYIMLSPMPRYLYSSPFQKFVLLHNDFIESAQDDQGRQILALYLRVILNLTNNECLACEQYASPEMIIGFARIVSAGLSSASAFFGSNEHDPVSLVILALGILTNLAEQSESCRACFLMPAHDSQPPLDILVQQFSLNIDLVSHAKSVSEVHSTVAVGYLSILLAVLCLHTEPCARIRELLLNFGREVASVKSTAKEFFLYYEKAERDSRLTEPQENGNTSTAQSYYPTIENTFSRIIKYNGQDFATEIVDTAGQDEYSILNSKHFIGIHGYIIVYSLSSRQSFDMVRVIRDKILNHLGADHVPLVIVGNKSDLKSEQRQVSLEEGRQLGEEFHCAFTEASARLDYNVGKAFDLIIGEIEKSQNPSQPAGGNKCSVM
ncbi:ras-domain-containing protein [Aspergillus homomorphus CBS 101889]|uniref:Ras-domain-containing protein n=1 Tax=Aspergillus homomorphus (strain CBS 101889) TaxID=1450537 RepID=A0A395HNI3_ASPHC|nr:ras-domain-containing protein [Aspergillus homomorphus CBS 101889]RAL08398.1 ras-domain-containing protein [Aspergillus homomorphus CBS 101889]